MKREENFVSIDIVTACVIVLIIQRGPRAVSRIAVPHNGFSLAGSGVNLLLITPEKAIKLVGNDFFRYCLSDSK